MQVHLGLSFSLRSTIPSIPSRHVFEDGKKNILLSVGSYPSAHESPGQFKDGVLGTLIGAIFSEINELHLWVLDLHRRMESKGFRLFADDAPTPKPEQVDIQTFHKHLPATLREGLELFLDYNACAGLQTRREALTEAGRAEPAWAVWGHFGARVLVPVLIQTSLSFGETRELMNHPQGIQTFHRLRYIPMLHLFLNLVTVHAKPTMNCFPLPQ